jgi:prepilin-type processing-associated H-X9-DG protein
MQPDLVGYLLGALDGPEQDEIRHQLLQDDELRGALSDLEERLSPLESLRWDHEPPEHLTAVTCALVAQHAGLHSPRVFSPDMTRAEQPAGSGSARSWRWIDMVVAAAVLVIFSTLLSPAVLNMRQQSRITACRDHLRGLGTAFPSWAERMDGWLPHIPSAGNAGVAGFYAPQLKDAGLIVDDSQVLCPDSRLAVAANRFQIPSVQQVFLARGALLAEMQRQMGGSYNYGLGYVTNGRHAPRRFTGRQHMAVLGDRLVKSGQAGPHGSDGVNILFEDGHVRFVRLNPGGNRSTGERLSTLDPRELYVSDRGSVEAGSTADDIVLAPSAARPFPRQVEHILLSEPALTVFDVMHRTIDRRAINTGSVVHGSSSAIFMPWYYTP